MDERIARLEEKVSVLADRAAALEREMGSARDSESVRGRLHVVENDRAAAKAAAAALDAFREQRDRRWGKREKVGLALVALVAAPGTIVVPYVTLYLTLRGR